MIYTLLATLLLWETNVAVALYYALNSSVIKYASEFLWGTALQ